VLRGLDDFRVRVQENGVGSMDVSDYRQDHGVPLDPLSTRLARTCATFGQHARSYHRILVTEWIRRQRFELAI
jgi:hypothetical protein